MLSTLDRQKTVSRGRYLPYLSMILVTAIRHDRTERLVQLAIKSSGTEALQARPIQVRLNVKRFSILLRARVSPTSGGKGARRPEIHAPGLEFPRSGRC